MHAVDWLVLAGVLGLIVGYGLWATRRDRSAEGYLKGKETPWWTVGLSVMATQASAITFISTPGQAYAEGLGFIQFYFGLPLAMVVISLFFVPRFFKAKVYTAYEYLENRFDRRVRWLAAAIFLAQRGLAAGITIFAPSIILSAVLVWPLWLCNLIIGGLVIVYTVSGGTKAVTATQKYQMVIMLSGMVLALVTVFQLLPEQVSAGEAVHMVGNLGKLQAIDTEFNLANRYNLWSGLLGGFFLALAYFGTDQSQVQRYLGGRSLRDSRLGLLFNGMLKLPMQLLILFVGVMVFLFFNYEHHPIIFNPAISEQMEATDQAMAWAELQEDFDAAHDQRALALQGVGAAPGAQDGQEATAAYGAANARLDGIRQQAKALVSATLPAAELEDTDYVFLHFVLNYMPVGLVGLLLAVIFSAAMSSTAGELSALSTTTTVDFYYTLRPKPATESQQLLISRLFTLGWGLVALTFASVVSLFDNLIEAINFIGSVFYGTVLGLFVVAFALRRVGARAAFVAALVAQSVVIVFAFGDWVGYLWLNLIGCAAVVLLALVLQQLFGKGGHSRA